MNRNITSQKNFKKIYEKPDSFNNFTVSLLKTL